MPGRFTLESVADFVGIRTPSGTVLVDDADLASGASFIGSWFPSTCEGVVNPPNCYGSGYTYAIQGVTSGTFSWTPALASAGRYQVYARWPSHASFTSSAIYAIAHSGGTANVTVSHRTGGGAWHLLGTFDFAAGPAPIALSSQGNGNVIADAVRWCRLRTQVVRSPWITPAGRLRKP